MSHAFKLLSRIYPSAATLPTVLVVDDNAGTLKLACRALADLPVEVVAMDSVEEAIEFLHWHVPDLVVTDLIFPTQSGFSLLETLQASPRLRAVPVVVISGRKHEVIVDRARTLGAAEVLAKPVAPEALRALVESYFP